MRKCCIIDCAGTNKYRFKLPSDHRKDIWLNAIGKQNIVFKKSCVICGDHFSESDFIEESFETGLPLTRKVLRRSAVPRISEIKPEQCLEISTYKENKNVCNNFISEYADCANKITLVDVNQFLVQEPESSPEKDISNLRRKLNYCRLCAKLFPTEDLLPIFVSSGYTIYGDMLELCLPGKFEINDKYPHGICSSCTDKLENCSSILMSFIEADNCLRNIFNNNDASIRIDDKLNDPISEPLDNSNDSLDDKSLIKLEAEDGVLCNNNDQVFNNSNKSTENIERTLLNKTTPFSGIDKKRTIEKEKQEIKFQCLTCLKLFNNRKEVTGHSVLSHSSKKNEKVFRVVKAVLKNPKSNKKVNYKNVNSVINTENVFPVKRNIEIFENKFECMKCSQLFKEKKDLLEHTIEEHPAVSKYNIFCKLMKRKLIDSDENQSEEQFTFVRYERIFLKHYCKTIQMKNKKSVEITETFQIKYECKACSLLFISYKDVLTHAEQLHPTLKESGTVALVVKVRYMNEHHERNPLNEKNNLINFLKNVSDSQIISINDGTIFEIDPNIEPERERIKYSEPKLKMETRYKCMKCARLFTTIKRLRQHSLTYHQSQTGIEINCKIVTVKKLSYKGSVRKTYECLICCSNHITKHGLIQHTNLLHSSMSKDKFLYRFIDPSIKQSRECLHCSAVLHNYKRYREHMQKHVSFACEKCEEKFYNLNDLRDHLHQHKEMKPIKEAYKCVDCDEPFTSKLKLHRHRQTHKVLKQVMCSKCNKTFSSELELKKHKEVHESRVCEVCGKTFDLKYLQSHLQTHNIDTPYKCKICLKEFKSQCLASAHKKYHNVKNVMCHICGKITKQRTYRNHMLIHTSERSHVCDVCGMTFRRKYHLQVHKKTHMQDRGKKCPLCNIPLCNVRSYRSHMSVIHGLEKSDIDIETPNTCSICKKHFTHKAFLDDHYRRHRKRLFSCKVCNKKFSSQLYFIQHKSLHENYDQLPYKCDLCDKNFKRNEHLRNHRRIHTGEKPFPCPICHRSFRIRAEMIKHLRIHKRKDETQKYSNDVVTSQYVNYEIDTSECN